MDAFSWIIVVALGACLLMHLLGHGHGGKDHSHGEERHGHAARQSGRDKADRMMTGAGSGHRTGHGGCH